MTIARRNLLQGGAALLASPALPALAQQRVRARIGVLQTAGAGPMYLALERGYFAAEGLDAEIIKFDSAQPLAVRDTPEEAFVLVASRRHSSPAQERLLAGLGQWFADLQLTSVGSSLKFCLLAEGAADCYPRLAPTSQWDTAAAQAVLEGAGGLVLDLHGEPLRYPPRADFLNPHFLALPQAAPWRSQLLQLARSLD